MALRYIRERGDEVLAKKCKPVKEVNPRIIGILEDMVDTMNDADGVGLAAPQIGIIKRMFVARPHVDEDDEEKQNKIYFMINPEITYKEGTQESSEGCLSVPGYMGLVERPKKIKITATDIDGKRKDYEFEDFEATVFCHEMDHLDGVLYSDKAEDFMTIEEYAKRLEEIKLKEQE